ncbi:hypothetical protein [Belliella filtrata]|nr:hypothetical protein [Belliella filtrata]
MRSHIVLLVILLTFSACDDVVPTENLNPEPYPAIENLSEEIIYVRESDFEVKREFAWDIHTEASLSYTEGSLFGLYGKNILSRSRSRFGSQISYACANSKINGFEMCKPDYYCNYEEYFKTGAWDSYGEVKTPGYFEWEFVDLHLTKKFILKFDELPKPAKITSYESTLNLDGMNRIEFQKENPADSVFFQLVKIQKSNFELDNYTGTSTTSFAFLTDGNSFEFHGDDLFPYDRSAVPTEQDSVFINVVTVKRIIKEVNNTLFGFTYYVNDLKPIRLN